MQWDRGERGGGGGEWMRAAGSALPACLPVVCWSWVYRRATLHWHRAESRPICTPSAHSAPIRSHTALVLTSASTTSKENQGPSSPAFSPSSRGTQQLRRGLTLQFRHQLLPQPNPPPPYPILTNTTTTPLLLLPMPLSSAAPLTSLASIWIEAPCFSSYKSR